MAVFPDKPISFELTDEQLLTGICENLGGEFRDFVPVVTAEDREHLADVVCGGGDFMNRFLTPLVNRIIEYFCFNTIYEGHLKKFKRATTRKGGDVIQNIYFNLILPEGWTQSEFTPGDAYAINNPDCKASYHPINSMRQYETTVNADQLRLAITEDMGGLIGKIIGMLQTSCNFDDDTLTKATMQRAILDNWDDITVEVPVPSESTAKTIVKRMKQASLDLKWMNDEHNIMKWPAETPIERQHFFITNALSAEVDVEALAMAFNLPYMDFLGIREEINSFNLSTLEQTRLDHIMAETAANHLIPGYTPLTAAEKAKLDRVVAVTIDYNFFMIFNALFKMTTQPDPKHFNENIYLTTWDIFSYNPFAQIVVFVTPAA